MKFLPFIALIAATLVGSAEEKKPVLPVPAVVDTPRAWLGLKVSKPDATLTAQLPNLPPGIGFIVGSVDAGGPAENAGLREYDILWKLGDQMLVNEAQFAALLRLQKPGDEIKFTGFRAGKPLEVTVKLGQAPLTTPPFPGELVDSVILPGVCGGPMRVVNRAEQTASYNTEDGSLLVRRENSIYHVSIKAPDGTSIYQGEITDRNAMAQVPQEWRRRVGALCRGLDHVLDGQLAAPRQPRPRVVPPPSADAR